MLLEQNSAVQPVSRLDQARQVLHAHLAVLARLAAIAVGLITSAGQGDCKPARRAADPMAAIAALGAAIRREAKIFWAMRLLEALRAKLNNDLERVEQGGSLDFIFAAKAAESPSIGVQQVQLEADPAAQAERRENLRPERERLETESFGRFLGRRADDEFAEILKRPTEDVIALIREALGVDDAEGEADPRKRGRERPRPPEGLRPPRPSGAEAAPDARPPDRRAPPELTVRFN